MVVISIQKGLKEPYDWDEYADMFFPKAQELAHIAAEAEKAGEKERASEYYLSVLPYLDDLPPPSRTSVVKGSCLSLARDVSN